MWHIAMPVDEPSTASRAEDCDSTDGKPQLEAVASPMIIQDVADFARPVVLTYCEGYAKDQFGVRRYSVPDSMFSRSCCGFCAACVRWPL